MKNNLVLFMSFFSLAIAGTAFSNTCPPGFIQGGCVVQHGIRNCSCIPYHGGQGGCAEGYKPGNHCPSYHGVRHCDCVPNREPGSANDPESFMTSLTENQT